MGKKTLQGLWSLIQKLEEKGSMCQGIIAVFEDFSCFKYELVAEP